MDIDKNNDHFKHKTYNEIIKEHDTFQNYVVKCKCSHSVLFTGVKDRILCTHCGHYVYKDKKTELKYKLKEKMR